MVLLARTRKIIRKAAVKPSQAFRGSQPRRSLYFSYAEESRISGENTSFNLKIQNPRGVGCSVDVGEGSPTTARAPL